MLLLFSVILLCMFCFPGICIEGAKAGLLLWFNTVLPSIFPFLIITTYLTSHIKSSKSNILLYICALLSGLPIGAKVAADSVKVKVVSPRKAYFIFTALNNAGPSFIFGYVANSLFHSKTFGLQLLIITLISSILSSSVIYLLYGHRFMNHTVNVEIDSSACLQDTNIPVSHPDSSFNNAVLSAILTISGIGGYIILFSIANCFLCHLINSLFTDTTTLPACIAALLEITTGTELLVQIRLSDKMKKALISAFIIFGGLSGLVQTYSVSSDSGLSIIYYVAVKMLAGAIALVLCFIL